MADSRRDNPYYTAEHRGHSRRLPTLRPLHNENPNPAFLQFVSQPVLRSQIAVLGNGRGDREAPATGGPVGETPCRQLPAEVGEAQPDAEVRRGDRVRQRVLAGRPRRSRVLAHTAAPKELPPLHTFGVAGTPHRLRCGPNGATAGSQGWSGAEPLEPRVNRILGPEGVTRFRKGHPSVRGGPDPGNPFGVAGTFCRWYQGFRSAPPLATVRNPFGVAKT